MGPPQVPSFCSRRDGCPLDKQAGSAAGEKILGVGGGNRGGGERLECETGLDATKSQPRKLRWGGGRDDAPGEEDGTELSCGQWGWRGEAPARESSEAGDKLGCGGGTGD